MYKDLVGFKVIMNGQQFNEVVWTSGGMADALVLETSA